MKFCAGVGATVSNAGVLLAKGGMAPTTCSGPRAFPTPDGTAVTHDIALAVTPVTYDRTSADIATGRATTTTNTRTCNSDPGGTGRHTANWQDAAGDFLRFRFAHHGRYPLYVCTNLPRRGQRTQAPEFSGAIALPPATKGNL